MAQFQVIAHHRVAADRDPDEVLGLYAQLAAATRDEPGNVSFDVYRQLEDDRGFVILERYASREAAAAHERTPHFQELLLGQVVPRLEKRWRESYDVTE